MSLDVNVKALMKNAFRQSKVRGETASRVRVPGGLINAESMARVVEIAQEFGNGTIFLTNRQGMEIPGIPLEKVPEGNERLARMISSAASSTVLITGSTSRPAARSSSARYVFAV